MKKIIIIVMIICGVVFADSHCMGCSAPYLDHSAECIEMSNALLDIVGKCEYNKTTLNTVVFTCDYGIVSFNKYDQSARMQVKKDNKRFSFDNSGTCFFTEFDEYGIKKDGWTFNIRAESYGYKKKIYTYFKSNNF